MLLNQKLLNFNKATAHVNRDVNKFTVTIKLLLKQNGTKVTYRGN